MRYGRLGFWYRLVVVVARPFMRMSASMEWRGVENLPKTGGVLVAANHVGYVDPFAIGLFALDAGRVPKFLAKASLFEHPLTKRIFIGAKQIPVYRGTADAAAALSAAVDALRDGDCLLIYPEGTVTRDPDLWPMMARTGVARLALESGAPVVPIAQWGPQDVWQYKAKLPRPFPRKKIVLLAGPPIDLSAYLGKPIDADLLHEVTEVVMAHITELLVELRGGTPPAVTFDPRSGSGAAA